MPEPATSLPLRMSLAEFLTWDDGTDTRYELIDGVVTAMAPPARLHSRIAANVIASLHRRLRPPCSVHGECGVRLEGRDDTFFQADVAVICGGPSDVDPFPPPALVVEVLSPTTLAHDRGRKATDYRLITGCDCILLIHSDRRRVERWTREGDHWIVRDHIGPEGTVPIENLGIELELGEIYEGT